MPTPARERASYLTESDGSQSRHEGSSPFRLRDTHAAGHDGFPSPAVGNFSRLSWSVRDDDRPAARASIRGRIPGAVAQLEAPQSVLSPDGAAQPDVRR